MCNMDYGKVKDLSQVNFDLPPDPQLTVEVLKNIGKQGKIFLGATAWSDRAFVGELYPKGTKPGAYLYHYARQYDTIELNATHYGIPSIFQLEKWRDSTPEGFKFCPKVPQEISHRPDLGLKSGALKEYLSVIDTLEDKLGMQFIQFSPNFSPEYEDLLLTFLEQWPQEFPLGIELRHEDWFTSGHVWELLHQRGVGTVITDVAGRRDVLHMHITAPHTMIRFVGNGLHPTDFVRLADWIKRLKKWKDAGLTTYFIPHQPEIPEMIQMSLRASKDMRASGLQVPEIKSLAYGVQTGLFA